MDIFDKWQTFALGSAFFAAQTAIFGKLGVLNIGSNLATFIRTVIILILIGGIVSFRQEWQRPDSLDSKGLIFLALSALATGLSWLCYYRALQLGPASRVAPVDKLSVALAMALAFIFLGEKLSWLACLGGLLITMGAFLMGNLVRTRMSISILP